MENNAIDGIDVPLLKRVVVHRSHLVFEDDWVSRKKEGPEPWCSDQLVAVVFLEHEAEIFIGFYRNQGIKVLRDQLVLEDHITFD